MINEEEYLRQVEFAKECRQRAGGTKILRVGISDPGVEGYVVEFTPLTIESVRYALEHKIDRFEVGWEFRGDQRWFEVGLEHLVGDDPRDTILELLQEHVANLIWRERYPTYALPKVPDWLVP